MKFLSVVALVPVDVPASSVPAPRRSRILRVAGSVALAGLFSLLSACGGGGGGAGTMPVAGGGTTTPTNPTTPGAITYPLQAAFKALTQNGSTDNFTVTGDCTGTAQTVNGAATAASFGGVNGFSTTENATLTVPSCSSQSTVSSGMNYYDTNYAPLGTITVGGVYTAIAGSPVGLPASVQVGDSVPIDIIYISYTDSTRTVRTGQVIQGYTIEADTASGATTSTAIYHVTSRAYDANNNLVSTLQSFYRVGTTGSMALVSLDVQDNTLLALHLVYTRIN